MPKYKISGTYTYSADCIEAKTEEEALSYFYNHLNEYYEYPDDEETTLLCDVCEEDKDTCTCEPEEEEAE